jgi:DNA-directed RNA polymerase subunit M/transcription elongation factor TFIIS
MSLDDNIRKDNVKELEKILKNKKLSNEVEDSIYNFSMNYAENNNTMFLLKSIYNDKFEKIKCLLRTSEYILKSLKSKKIKGKDLAFLKPEELNPDKYIDILTKKEIEEFKKNNQATTDAYKCPKCKKRKCSVTEKQTRSSDEPATVYVKCKNPDCGYEFRF